MTTEDKILVGPARMSVGMAFFAPFGCCVPVVGGFAVLGVAAVGVYTAYTALQTIKSDPETYTGENWAYAGLVLNGLWLVGAFGSIGMNLLGLALT